MTLNEKDFFKHIPGRGEKDAGEIEDYGKLQEIEDRGAANEYPGGPEPFPIHSKIVILSLLIGELYWSYSNLVYISITFSCGTFPGRGVFQGVAMDYLKYHEDSLCPTLLCLWAASGVAACRACSMPSSTEK
jgi:hypothetical protein